MNQVITFIILSSILLNISCKTFRKDHNSCLTLKDIEDLQYTQELKNKAGKLVQASKTLVSELSCNGLYTL